MKKLIRISFLLTMLCFVVPAYADGDMTTGNKNCTQNCGFTGVTTQGTTTSENNRKDESSLGTIYDFILNQISVFLD